MRLLGALMRLLGAPMAFARGMRSDKEARNELPLTTCESGIARSSLYYQHRPPDLGYSQYTKPGGAHVGCGCSRLQGPVGGEGAVTRRVEMRSHELHAIQTHFSHLRTITAKSGPWATQNVQSQAVRMSDAAARGSKDL
jgi:hypothetical protein